MYKIKQIPEDFIVKEIPSYTLDENGQFSYFLLRKRSYNTLDAVSKIAEKLRIRLKNIGFAGTKDRNAITEQAISIKNIRLNKIANLKLKDINLELIGKGENPISLGDLIGNQFKITVRNLPNQRLILKSPKNIPNFFGPQRFSKNNIEIGKALVKKNFQKAINLIDNYRVKEFIEDAPGDLIGAIRTLPLKLRRLYIHAYQSYIWNKTIEEYLKTNPKNELIPIIGFGTELRINIIGKIIRKILTKEEITQRDFIIKQLPEISSEGSKRQLLMTPEDFKIKTEKDELNENKIKAILSFSLKKASYATVIIEHIFSSYHLPFK